MQNNKKILKIVGLVLGIVLLLALGFAGYFYFTVRSVSKDQIKYNIPDSAVFDNYLSRDLNNYFKERQGNETIVEYEFLQNGVTQSGIAYPKYYLWVIVRDSSNVSILDEGAVRVAAEKGEQFSVTDFISKTNIQNDIDLTSIFPVEVISKIEQKIKT